MDTPEHQQNGRRNVNNVAGHPADPRLANQVARQPICRNFVRGTCNQYGRCKYLHKWDLREIKEQEIIKFCHDFQNNVGCRGGCKYLHASKEEEELFWNKGQLPRILAERHAMMYGYMGDPSPSGSMLGRPLPPPSRFQQLPPPPPVAAVLPPPPPPPVVDLPATAATAAPPHQSLPTAASTSAVKNTYLPKFDASRPPPPILKKKKARDISEAGPSKVRKLDSANLASCLCINCVQRQLRINFHKQEIERLRAEEEQKSLAYNKRRKDYEKGKELLKSLTSPGFNILCEGTTAPPVSPVNDFLSSIGQPQNTVANLMSKTILKNLMGLMFGGGRNFMDSSLMSDDEEDIIQTLSVSQRRTSSPEANTSSSSNNNHASDLLHDLLQTVQNNSLGGGVESQPRNEAISAVAAYRPAIPPPSLYNVAPPPITAASWPLNSAAVSPSAAVTSSWPASTCTTSSWPPTPSIATTPLAISTTTWPSSTTATPVPTTTSLQPPPPPPPTAYRKYSHFPQ